MLDENQVITIGGFIGRTTDGIITTYERGGSDRTAADLGILLHKKFGVKIDLEQIEMMEEKALQNGKSFVGHLRSAVHSPHFKKVVGIAMIKKEYWDKKTPFELEINGKKSKGLICDLPLV